MIDKNYNKLTIQLKNPSHLCQNSASRQKYVLILFFKFKDYTLNYGPVFFLYNHITSFTSRKIFSFQENQLRMGHLYFNVTSSFYVHTLHSLGYNENGPEPCQIEPKL